MPYKDRTHPKVNYADWTYNNSRRGFIVIKIGSMFKPSNWKKREGRNTFWIPECTRQDVYRKLMNYIIIMKERYPQTDGYICCYCKYPWSFYTHHKIRGKGLKTRSKLTPETEHNFSIDRWDPTITYTYDNIRFCCLGCNNRKSSSTPLDWDNFKEAKDDIR